MDIYLKLFEVLFPVFFIVGIGYYLGKKNPKLDTFISLLTLLLMLVHLQWFYMLLQQLGYLLNNIQEYFWLLFNMLY
jgi:hypothetical protein